MKNLGKKDRMYPSMAEDQKEPEVRYPSVRLPLSLFDKKLSLDDEVTLSLKGRVTALENEYSEEATIELKEGESTKTAEG